jgi:hypothetical protein
MPNFVSHPNSALDNSFDRNNFSRAHETRPINLQLLSIRIRCTRNSENVQMILKHFKFLNFLYIFVNYPLKTIFKIKIRFYSIQNAFWKQKTSSRIY